MTRILVLCFCVLLSGAVRDPAFAGEEPAPPKVPPQPVANETAPDELPPETTEEKAVASPEEVAARAAWDWMNALQAHRRDLGGREPEPLPGSEDPRRRRIPTAPRSARPTTRWVP